MTELDMNHVTIPEITIIDGVADQEELNQEAVNALPQDDKMKLLSRYRDIVREGNEITLRLNGNSLRILRSLRAKSIVNNPRAKKGAKEKAQVGTLDLGLASLTMPKKED